MAKLADLNVNIGAKTDDFSKGLKDVQKETNALSSGIGKIGGLVAGAFAVGTVVSFASEVSKLAQAAEGVEIAFKRIGGEQYMDGLRRATKGTVSDLELMKAAVDANNFKIPLDQLGSLLEFAHQRAKDTGKSVDYLVQSIVLGIGRKSPMILDNLGITTVALKDKMKGVAAETATVGDMAKAVGAIAAEEMAKIGSSSETTSEKVGKVSAEFANLKVELGKLVNVLVGALAPKMSKFLSDLNKFITGAKSALGKGEKVDVAGIEFKYIKEAAAEYEKSGLSAAESLTKAFTEYKTNTQQLIANAIQSKEADEAQKLKSNYESQIKSVEQLYNAALKLIPKKQEEIKNMRTIADITADIERKTEELTKATDIKDSKRLIALEKEIEALENQKKALLELHKATKDVTKRGPVDIPARMAPIGISKVSSTQTTYRPEYAPMEDSPMTTIFGSVNGQLPTDEVEEFAAAWERAGNSIMDVTETLRAGMADFVADFAAAIGSLADSTNSWSDVGKVVLMNVSSFMTTLGKQLIALGTAGIAAKALATNPATALAAGAMLVAAGSAINATMSSNPMSGGSKGVSRSSYSNVGSGSMTLEVVGVTRGEDIYWSQKRTEQRLNNTSPRTR